MPTFSLAAKADQALSHRREAVRGVGGHPMQHAVQHHASRLRFGPLTGHSLLREKAQIMRFLPGRAALHQHDQQEEQADGEPAAGA